MSEDWDAMKRLIQATYFSGTCRQEAAAIGIPRMADAGALVATFMAFEQRDSMARCRPPGSVILLTNLLRLNGLDAELAFISMMPPDSPAAGRAPDKIDRVLVYVPALARYVDLVAPPGKQIVLDRIIREKATRSHFVGPSLANDARGACHDTCLYVYPPQGASTVKTETIRGR